VVALVSVLFHYRSIHLLLLLSVHLLLLLSVHLLLLLNELNLADGVGRFRTGHSRVLV
jgi:hypothetical protein